LPTSTQPVILYNLLRDNDLVNKYEFFIDLYFSTQDFEYPVRLPKLLEWIRRETSGANKKFLIYYIIKKEFETLASQPNLTQPHDITKEICDALYKSFLEEFKLVITQFFLIIP
jgi:hypothetical protein